MFPHGMHMAVVYPFSSARHWWPIAMERKGHLRALSLFSSANRCASLALALKSSTRSFNASKSTFKPS